MRSTATVRIGDKHYALRRASVTFKTGAQTLSMRMAAPKRVRRAIREALAKRRAVRADVRIVASDVLGNDTVVRRTVAIRG